MLIGLAVADLEATRARRPSSEELRRAVTEARVALDKARDIYPYSGDLHVNLATVALLAHDAPLAKRHLAKANEVGNISIDALPFLYNLSGLIALQEGHFPVAVAEFEKVNEFKPGWTVPRLNLAAAYAQSLFRGDLTEAKAALYARSIEGIVGQLKRDRNPLLPLVYHALAVHRVRKRDYEGALKELREAEKYGEQSWHARFNRAAAQYLIAVQTRTPETRRTALVQEVRPVFERALRSKRATPRDVFVAAAALGRLSADEQKLKPAIEYFERAAAVKPSAKDRFIPEALPRVHRSLASVCYAAGEYRKAREHLEQSSGLKDNEKTAAALLGQLRTKPTITDFSVKLGKIVTDYDMRVAATLAAKASPDPIEPKNVRLMLVNHTDKTSRSLPFQLVGSRLHALVINVPQGAYRVECQVTDSVGNASAVAAKTLSIDREPPRVLQRTPAPNATVKALQTIDFRVFDALGSVDFESLTVILKYPRTAKAATRFLVSRGKYVYDAPDGSIKKGTAAADSVRCPVPADWTKGTYIVMVRVRDLEGRLNEAEWSFEIR